MCKFVNISWIITSEQAQKYLHTLERLHAELPQPVAGGIRQFTVKPLEGASVATLRYTTELNEFLFEYNIIQSFKAGAAVCAYTGTDNDFGVGEVGPFVGIRQCKDIKFVRSDAWRKALGTGE